MKMIELIYKGNFDKSDVDMFFEMIKGARGLRSKIQYCDIYAINLLREKKYEYAIKVMSFAKEINTDQEHDLGRYYWVLGEIEEDFYKNYDKALEYYALWEQSCPNSHGYNFAILVCLIKKHKYAYNDSIESVFHKVLEEESQFQFSRKYRFYKSLSLAIISSRQINLQTVKMYLSECNEIINERGESILQTLLKRHRIKDDLDYKVVKDDLKLAIKALLKKNDGSGEINEKI